MNKRQKLFNYFQQEHGIMLMDSDYNELEECLKEDETEQGPDIIAFGMYLTGHDRETVEQMYKDWK